MSTEDTKQGWSALAKGAIGTVVVAFAGFLGTAAIQVLSAPKDTVAYDFVQSVTGMLKGDQQKTAAAPAAKPAPAEEKQVAAATPQAVQQAIAPASKPATTPAPTAPQAQPKVGLPSAADVQPAPPVKEARAEPVTPQPGSMLDRVRQTTDLADKTRANTQAMLNSRVMSLNDKAEAPICGAVYKVNVTSVEAGRGQVALQGAGAPITLAVGAPQEVSAGCKVELLLAMDDLNNRRAQLRETLAR